MRFYSKIPDMECLAGDTLPEFMIRADGDISGCTMQLILARSHTPDKAALIKECTAISGGFSVRLTSDDTASLPEDTYIMHFRLADKSGLSLRKLAGELYVRTVPKGGA